MDFFQSNRAKLSSPRLSSFQIKTHPATPNEIILTPLFDDSNCKKYESSFIMQQPYKFKFLQKRGSAFVFQRQDGQFLNNLQNIEEKTLIHIYSKLLNAVYLLHKTKQLARCISPETVYLTLQGEVQFLYCGFYPQLTENSRKYDEFIDIYLIGVIMQELQKKLNHEPLDNLGKRLLKIIPIISNLNSYQVKDYSDLHLILDLPDPEILKYYQTHLFKQDAFVIQSEIENRDGNHNLHFIKPITNESLLNEQIQVKHLPSDISPGLDDTQDLVNIEEYMEFIYYRFTFMDQTILNLNKIGKQLQSALVKCLIIKVKVTLANQFVEQLQKNQNIIQIDPKSWENYIQTDKKTTTIKQLIDIKNKSIEEYQQRYAEFLQIHSTSALSDTQNINSEMYQILKSNINDIKAFDDLKIQYRICLNYFIRSIALSSNSDRYKSLLIFQLTVCMLIKSIFDFTNLDFTFKIILQHLQLTQRVYAITKPSQINKFMEEAAPQQLYKLADSISCMYLPKMTIN